MSNTELERKKDGKRHRVWGPIEGSSPNAREKERKRQTDEGLGKEGGGRERALAGGWGQ